MSNSGAKAALKGYRLQTLYILREILQAKNSELIFQPEGNEDLAVYQGEKLIRAVQVKALGEPLVLSHFIETDKTDTFIHRSLDLLKSDESPRLEVISFGAIGNEIASAWSESDTNKETNQNKIRRKLVNLKISDYQVDQLFENLVWGSVKEHELHQEISKYLSQTLTSGSIEHALSLLTSWLYVASEQKAKITHEVLFEKISSIGRYFSEREAYHLEWFKSIIPLEAKTYAEEKRLEKEYYRGVSTRFSHIQADLDILRKKLLTEIEYQFEESQTVIIHGASGQGKTTLAYRYLFEYVPEPWRLQINFIEDRTHAQSIALAIADQLSIFDATLYLYIDVSPRDSNWTDLVKALLEKQNVKILISIREEDLARQNISNEQLGFPTLVPIKLSIEEAKYIYSNLIEKGVATPYPSFEQAWLGFGGKGSLLEYVFFLTQTESLKDRLVAQVSRLRAEVRGSKLEASAIKFLLASAIATSYETRVDIRSLVKATELQDPHGTLNLFENEYLIRLANDKTYIEALHPIRSKLLVDALVDPALSPWIDSALFVMPSIPEADLETFLLYSFVEHPNEFQKLFESIKTLNIKTWGAIAGIGRALLWFGIRNHVTENRATISSARAFAGGDGWLLLLQSDVGGAVEKDLAEDLLNVLGKNNPLALTNIKTLKQQMSEPTKVYRYIHEWLTHIPKDLSTPKSNSDWSAMGEVLLWTGKLGVTNNIDVSWLLKINIDSEFEDIVPLSDLTLGLFYFSYDLYLSFMSKNNQNVISLFQRKTNTIWLEQRQGNPTAHYIIPDIHLELYKYAGSYLNAESVAKTQILRNLYPDQEKYGANGYGHQNILMDLPYDESKKNIIKSGIPLRQFVSVNSTWANYADYIFRPNNWQEYASNILSVREQIVTALAKLNKNLINYFRKKKSQSLIGIGKIEPEYWESLAKINWQLTQLPKLAVDPWGITSEGTVRDNIVEGKAYTTNFVSMQEDSKNFRKSLRNYIFPLTNFFSQSHFILIFNGLIGRLPEDQHGEFFKRAESLETPFNRHNIHLSCVNFKDAHNSLKQFQHEFRSMFIDFVSHKKLGQIEKEEEDNINKSWALWYQFAHHPEKYWADSPDIRASEIITSVKNNLFNAVNSSLKNMSHNGFRASILSENYEYNGKNALWINVDISDFLDIENIFFITIDALTDAIRPVNFTDLKYFVIAALWESIVIVPTNEGNSVSDTAWVLSTASFVGDGPVIEQDKPFLYIPRPIHHEAMAYLGLKSKDASYNKVLNGIEKEISGLFTIVNHMHCFEALAPNANEVGVQILKSYLSSLLEPLKRHIRLAEELIEKARKYAGEENTTLLSVLDGCTQAIQPFEESENNEINISLGDCRMWGELLYESLKQLQIIKISGYFEH